MGKSLSEWLSEGEQLYDAAVQEFRTLESQLEELEARLAAKQAEVNQIAQVIGKPPVETTHRAGTQVIEGGPDRGGTPSIIARALTGRQINRV